MQEYIPVRALQTNTTYSQIFLLSGVSNKVSKKNGHNFVLLEIKDVTATMRGCLWDFQVTETEPTLKAGNFVNLTIAVESYNNEKTFIVKNVAACSTPVENLTDYVPGPNDHVLKVLKEDIEKIISDIDDPHYRDIVNNACQHIRLLDLLAENAYEAEGLLAHRGGLLMHTSLALKTALGMVQTGREPSVDLRIDRSLVIASCLFRNIGFASGLKIDGTNFVPQDSIKLLGIRHLSTMWVNHILISTAEDLKIQIPEPKELALQNACFASTMNECLTIEARIVLLANQFSDEIHNGRNLYWKHRTV